MTIFILYADNLMKEKKVCKRIIKEQSTVDVRPVRFNNVGVPRSGKTYFRRRMRGEVENIEKDGGELEQPSTAVAEDAGQIIIKNKCSDNHDVVSSTIWRILTKEGNIMDLFHCTFSESAKASTSHATAENVIIEAMKEGAFDKVKSFFDDVIMLINTDTGGQAEFLDLHAALVQGPSFNLLFSRLTDPLDKPFKAHFTNKEGKSTEKVDSTLTLEEVLFQALSSIACFSSPVSSNCSSLDEASSSFQRYFNSKVMFVGTHRDLVSEEEFKEKDRLLRQRVEKTELYNRDIIEYASEEQLMIPVDNMHGGPEEINMIRATLEKVVRKSFKKIKVPVTWLMLVLLICGEKLRTMTLEHCEELAGKLGINPMDLPDVLWFLHHCLGVLFYFPELIPLKGTLITDLQVVFDSATHLIENTFTFDTVGRRACKRFEENGQFSMIDVKKAMSNFTDNLIPLEKLVALLEYLSILTTIPPDQADGEDSNPDPVFFMPCVLKSATPTELSSLANSSSDPAPLMLRYDCGYVPVGMFPSMIANFISQRLKGWTMIEKGVRKNRVQFRVGKDLDTITFISRPRFFEIVVSRSSDFQIPTESLCAHVRDVLETTLAAIASRMRYNFREKYKFGFECPDHPGREHLCLLADKEAIRMQCNKKPEEEEEIRSFPLQLRHKRWFKEELPVSRGHGGIEAWPVDVLVIAMVFSSLV